MTRIRLFVGAALALAMLAALTSSASAYRAADSRGGAISMVSLGKITMGGSVHVECNMTLNGTLAASFELVSGAHVGSITEVRIASCAGGTIGGILNLSWRITVNSILGTLPDSATGLLVNINNWSLNFGNLGGILNCLYAGTAEMLIGWNDTGTNAYSTGLAFMLEEVQLPFVRGSGLCPGGIPLAGEFGVSPLQTITVS